MFKKEVDPTDEEAILKGKMGYRVVWREDEELVTDESELDPKDHVDIESHSPGEGTGKVFVQKRVHHMHKHQQSIEYLAGVLGFIILVFLIFVKPILFWIVLFIAFFSFLIFWLARRIRTGYVDRMQQNVVYLKIKNPILTGFEIALGIGMFAAICVLIGLVILLIIAIGAGYGIWSLFSGFFL